MPISCSVKGCRWRHKLHLPRNVSLYMLPHNAPQELRCAWLKVCHGPRLTACSDHFVESDFAAQDPLGQFNGLRPLKQNVVPKLNVRMAKVEPPKEAEKTTSQCNDPNPSVSQEEPQIILQGFTVKNTEANHKEEEQKLTHHTCPDPLIRQNADSDIQIVSVQTLLREDTGKTEGKAGRVVLKEMKLARTNLKSALLEQISKKPVEKSSVDLDKLIQVENTTTVKRKRADEEPVEGERAVKRPNVRENSPEKLPDPSEISEDDDVIFLPPKIDIIDVDDESEGEHSSGKCNPISCQFISKVEAVLQKKSDLKKQLQTQKNQYAMLLKKEKKLRKNYQNILLLLDNVDNVLSETQKNIIFKTSEDIIWRLPEIKNALILRHLSEPLYTFLYNELKYPLPSLDSLQRWEEKFPASAEKIRKFAQDYEDLF
ncbi:uncharacterized protein LOC132266161 [Phlebotomus argentipes]|uniref:uncharacterized protein LOC132266161 n=1 Tax=Phlebotomus argentipes TaxID=94469 RepID=UPI002892B7EE|nr:uncharacterized protein LOC132266161 [Phlebotomus argentipes]